MTTLRFRSPVTRPLYPPRTGARIADEFYVTQRFTDPDFYWKNIDTAKYLAGHRATDIGNGQCGYPIVAMTSGKVFHLEDNATAYGAPNNALGQRLDVGHGVMIDVWHLASRSVANGATVSAGQEIGKLGKTGLGQICHAHFEARINGVRIDPEPLMFGGSITIGEEDDLTIPPGLKHAIQAKIGPSNRLRVSRGTTEGSRVTDKTEFVSFYGVADDANASYTIGGVTGIRWALVGFAGRFWETAFPLLYDIEPTPTGKELIPQPAADPQVVRELTEAVTRYTAVINEARAALAKVA